MAKVQIIIFSLFISVMAYGQRYEKVLFGDFERWAVRYVTESQVIGGAHPEGWAEANTSITYAVMAITSGSQGAFIGSLDIVLWMSENKLEY